MDYDVAWVLAGYSRSDIKVEMEQDKLLISTTDKHTDQQKPGPSRVRHLSVLLPQACKHIATYARSMI